MGTSTASSKAKIAVIVSTAAIVACAVVLLGVLFTAPISSVTTEHDGVTQLAVTSVLALPQSSKGTFLVAESQEKKLANGKPWLIARSYDGNPWENVPNLDFRPPKIDCDTASKCSITGAGNVTIRSVVVPQQLLTYANSSLHLAARLHMQATFGANKRELQRVSDFYGTNYTSWVLDQMKLAPTLARSYYRARANARPGQAGSPDPVTQPCDIGSRWHRFVFENRDKNKPLVIKLNSGASRFGLYVDGVLRGEVSSFLGKSYPGSGYTFPMTTRICGVDEVVGGSLSLNTNTANCDAPNLSWSNPAIEFVPSTATQLFTDSQVQLVPVIGARTGSYVLKFRAVACTNASDAAGNSFIRVGNMTLRFDKRIRWGTNTVENPMESGLTNQCPAIAQTYQNRNSCVKRSACGSILSFKSALFTLNDQIMRAWYLNNNRYVYYITSLRLEDPFNISPCSSGTSRWRRMGAMTCPAATALDQTTRNTIAAALSSSADKNPYVRDITLTGANCVPNTNTIGAQIQAGSECFQHVHPDLYSVRDFTRWVEIHDGNQQAMAGGKPNPIAKHAENGSVNINFPASHPMQRFFDRRARIPVVGRYGDQIDFEDLSSELQTEEIALLVGALRNSVNDSGTVACGSPGETETVAEYGSHFQVNNMEWWETLDSMDTPVPYGGDYKFVIQNLAVKAPDQLRQRVAWSLSNFIVISDNGGNEASGNPDGWTGFYDIFVRNAFGSYLDILRDISYSPMMGVYLSFTGNQAFVVNSNYPDENYAREIMQLFSIGLWKLNDDGTQQLDQYGLPLETYNNDDIMDFARVWTGFERQVGRNNLGNNYYYGNFVDAQHMRAAWHDRLPKARLDDGYIGDTYPLCTDLPPLIYLRKGARFEYTGASSAEGDTLDSGDPSTIGRRGRFAPPSNSSLHRALCAPAQTGGPCTFPLVVTLAANLPCTGTQECNAQRVQSVQITDPVTKVVRYYSFVPPPCVNLALFGSGKLAKRSWGFFMCADPNRRTVAPACCKSDDLSRPVQEYGSECLFANEVVNYNTALQRCAKRNLTTCSTDLQPLSPVWSYTCADYVYTWTNAACTIKVQVYRTGRVGIIDPAAPSIKLLTPNSNNFFRVYWTNDTFPLAVNGTCPSGCTLQPTPGGDSCICNFAIATNAVFTNLTQITAGANAVNFIAQKLPIGAPNPDILGTYLKCQTAQCTALTNVVVWLHGDDGGLLTQRTIFQLPPFRAGGRVRYLMNRVSIITISNRYSFRNPPHFSPLLGEVTDYSYADYVSDNLWSRRAEYEVEALLEHLFEHQNTAVFVSYRLIQHMVTSNPSPRYVNKVVQAFRTGTCGTIKFSGRYGDMAATVYAILMDHEARSPLVEADTTFGMVRDPLMQLYHVMRSLSYVSPNNREIYMQGLEDRGGVQPFSSHSVFGFYLPEFRPFGAIGQAGLVGPQVQIATTPNLIGFLNGLTSLIEYGLSSCDGFGVSGAHGGRWCETSGPRVSADGDLTWTPSNSATAAQIVDELNLLLTAGRLHDKTKQVLVNEYNKVRTNTVYDSEAIRHILKLLVATPEFETNTYNQVTQEVRQPLKRLVPSQGRPFKAVIVIFEEGGLDSFNMLVPHSNCPSKDLYAEYQSVRQGAALSKSALLPINTTAGTQPCNTFGVNPAMPKLHSLYRARDALFTANVGVLVEPVTQQTIVDGGRLPPSVGAHNIMTRSAQNLHAQSVAANGILGRLTDALYKVTPPYPTGLFSMVGNQKAVQGDTPAEFIAGQAGVVRLRDLQELKDGLANISSFKSNSVFAENQADLLFTSLNSTETLGKILGGTTTTVQFGSSYLDGQLQQVAKLIKAMPAAGYERLLFFTNSYGFDTHFTFDLSAPLGEVDRALGSFVDEMKTQGRWDDVVVISYSEFGRTMTSNGKGTDHGWGGNCWVAGGKVKGGQILGKYPHVLSDDSELSLGRGRLIPTTPFEALWKGIGEWFGVTSSLLGEVLPNLANFPVNQVFSRAQMFEN